jgi:beta-glucanase (GH16 family)
MSENAGISTHRRLIGSLAAGAVLTVLLVTPLSAQAATSVASGVAMPTGTQTIGGQTFTPTMSEDFTKNAALGSFTSVYGKAWGGYNGVKDTSGHGLYSPDQVLSVQDSTLDWYLHSSNGQPLVAAPQPTGYTGQTYGAYSVRYRTDAVKGYKTAFLLWPTSNQWADGEIDWPDGNLGGAINPASKLVGSLSNAFDKPAGNHPPVEGTGWHTATFTWTPGLVQFYLDGVFVGQTSNTGGVPTKAMRWVLQVETSLDGSTPAASASGHVQVDWVVQYKQG